jgi:hypothetical protein
VDCKERAGETEPGGCIDDEVCDGVLDVMATSWDNVEEFAEGAILARPTDFLRSKMPLPVRA